MISSTETFPQTVRESMRHKSSKAFFSFPYNYKRILFVSFLKQFFWPLEMKIQQMNILVTFP